MMFSLIILIVLKLPSVIFCFKASQNTFIIINCTLISPLLFNIIPTIAIFILNSLLVIKVIKYYKNISKNAEKPRLSLPLSKDNSNSTIHVRCFNYRPIKRMQKSHYLVISVLALWSVFITIPYYFLNTFYLLFRLNIFTIDVNFKTVNYIQIISSIFFNSNHCANFFIYLCFYKQFRNALFRTFLRKYFFKSRDFLFGRNYTEVNNIRNL